VIWLYAGAAVLVITNLATWRVQEWRHDAQDKARQDTAIETARLRAKGADTASAGHESFKEREHVRYLTITKTVDKIVDRPIYRAECFDADGLRELDAAVTGRDDTPGKPAPAVP
jgi:hypothetical protein